MPTSTDTAARAAAVIAVRSQLGLSNTPSDWSFAQRTQYNKALADYIASRPAAFDDQTLQIAEAVAKEPTAAPLADTSFDWGMMGDEMVKNAADLNPVPSWMSSAKWLLPVLAVLALAFFFAPQLGAGAGNYAAARVRSPRK